MSGIPVYCEQCGAPLAPGLRFCEACGHPAPRVFCEQCGARLAPGVGFCEECGSPVGAPTPQTPAPIQAPLPAGGHTPQPVWVAPAAPPVALPSSARRGAAAAPHRARKRSKRGLVLFLALLVLLIGAAAAVVLWYSGLLAGLSNPVILIATSTPTADVVIVVVTPPPPSPTATVMAPPTAEAPTATPAPTQALPSTDLPKRELLLQDALSANHIGWPEGESAELATNYYFEGDRYHMRMGMSGIQAISLPSPDRPDLWRFADFIYEVNATLVEGAGGQAYGLVFRHQDNDNYYLFEVNPLGGFQCSKVFQGSLNLLIDWTDHPAIRPGYDTNRLGVMARGGELSFYVNGVEVGAVSDGDLPEGKIGLAVVTYANGPVHASFGDLGVWAVR